MLDELIRSNAVDKRWAEELIAGTATLTVRLMVDLARTLH